MGDYNNQNAYICECVSQKPVKFRRIADTEIVTSDEDNDEDDEDDEDDDDEAQIEDILQLTVTASTDPSGASAKTSNKNARTVRRHFHASTLCNWVNKEVKYAKLHIAQFSF